MAAPKTKLAKCCRYCRIITTFLFSHVGLCALVLAYAFAGAFTFHYLEAGYEEEVRNRTNAKRLELVEALWRLTENQTVLVYDTWISGARNELLNFEADVIRAVKNDGFDGQDSGAEPQWSVTGAMLYSIIVITTIGYGNIAPKTAAGRLVTMLYAIAGIPLMLLCLSNIGDVMAHSFKFIYWKVCYALCIKQKKKRKPHRHHHRKHHRRHRSTPQTSGGGLQSTPGTSAGVAGSVENIPMRPMSAGSSYTMPSRIPTYQEPMSFGPVFSDHMDSNQVPIISNKYALQTEFSDEPFHYGTYPMARGRQDLGRPPIMGLTRTQMMRPPPLMHTVSMPAQLNPVEESESSSSSSSSDSEDEEDDEEGNVPIIMCMSLVVSYICGGAWLFRQWEDSWSYLDSAYFCFVTLTTIGFGDMVPGAAVVSGTEEGRTTLIICALYLLFGMALLAMSFNLVQEEVAKSLRNLARKIGIISDKSR